MYKIIFYESKKAKGSILAYMEELASRRDKKSRMNLNKIIAYFDILEEYGTRAGEPVTKHLEGEIWELRPLKNRILYAYVQNNQFIILHHFVKKTQKTPKRELERAKRNLEDYIERKKENGENME